MILVADDVGNCGIIPSVSTATIVTTTAGHIWVASADLDRATGELADISHWAATWIAERATRG